MLKTVTIHFDELNNRLEPRYHYYKNLHKQVFDKCGFKTINELSNLKSGTTPVHSEERNEKFPIIFIKSADVKRFNINYSTVSYISQDTHKKQIKSKILTLDILITNTGKYLGFASVYTPMEEANTNQNNIRIRLSENISNLFNPFFITSYFNSQFGQLEIQSLLTLTGQKYLNMSKFREMKVPIIKTEIVESISAELKQAYRIGDVSNTLIEESKSLLYDTLRIDFSKVKKPKFFYTNLFTFKDADLWTPQYSNPLYINTLKEIQKKFKTVPLGEITTIKKGNEVGSENYIDYIDRKETDVPFIRTTDLVNFECDQFPDFFVPENIYEELNQKLEVGDVLYTKDGKIGMTAMITRTDRVIIASGLIKLRLKNEALKKFGLTQEYLFTVLSCKDTGYFPAIRRTVIASTIPHLREERLKEIEIPILPKDRIEFITAKVKKAFCLKDKKKILVEKVLKEVNRFFEI